MTRTSTDRGEACCQTAPEPGPTADVAALDDPVIEAYKRDVDRTLLRENLRLTPAERFLKFERFMEYVDELRQAGRRARSVG
jgi:hypothetical protein